MCHKQGSMPSAVTGQGISKCPYHRHTKFRRDAQGNVFCPVGKESCVERAVSAGLFIKPNKKAALAAV